MLNLYFQAPAAENTNMSEPISLCQQLIPISNRVGYGYPPLTTGRTKL